MYLIGIINIWSGRVILNLDEETRQWYCITAMATIYNLQRRPVTNEYGTRFPDHGYKLHWEIWCGVGDLD